MFGAIVGEDVIVVGSVGVGNEEEARFAVSKRGRALTEKPLSPSKKCMYNVGMGNERVN